MVRILAKLKINANENRYYFVTKEKRLKSRFAVIRKIYCLSMTRRAPL